MDDGVAALRGAREVRSGGQVAAQNRDRILGEPELAGRAGSPGESTDPPAFFRQRPGDVPAEEACGPGQESSAASHGRILLTRVF